MKLMLFCLSLVTALACSGIAVGQEATPEQTPEQTPVAVPAQVPAEVPAEAASTSPEHAPWHSGNYWGVGVQSTIPTSDSRNRYATGYGVQGMYNYPLIPLIDISASAGWNHFPEGNDVQSLDMWEVAAGMRFAVGAFFMNGELGYYSKIDETAFIPGLGLRNTHWEASIRAKAAGANTWTTLRLGYYF